MKERRQCKNQYVVLAHLNDVVHHGWPEYPTKLARVLEFWREPEG